MRTYGFCLNSRRWLTFLMRTPKNCSYPNEGLLLCDKCGYYEERKPTAYFNNLLKIIKSIR